MARRQVNPNYSALTPEQKKREIERIKNSHNFWMQSKNIKIDGFSFDQDTFEDLVECYTPIGDIPVLLGVKTFELDNFCKAVYNIPYKDAYGALLAKSNAHNRKAINGLSKNGNQTAMKIVAEQFMGLGKIDNNEAPIQFICNIPGNVKSDAEMLATGSGESENDDKSEEVQK